MHSWNLGKYLFKLLGNVLPFVSSEPNHLKFTILERASLNGGKIVDKAKVFGNAKNMLNSIRLNNAIQLPINIRRRNLSTACISRRETLIFSEHE
jgi:hypothetical protein